MNTRTNNIISGKSGCIEDRTFIGAEQGELNQVPGADLFFTILKDVTNHTPTTLSHSVIDDVNAIKDDYTIHNDTSNDSDYGGCGFAKKLTDIAEELITNLDEILDGAHIKPEDREAARALVESLNTLSNSGYFDVTGKELVASAVDAGASMVTYTGEHTAGFVTCDNNDDSTYDSREANDPTTESNTGFNLDTNHARSRAEQLHLDPNASEILARLLSVATVRVLSGGAITQLTEE